MEKSIAILDKNINTPVSSPLFFLPYTQPFHVKQTSPGQADQPTQASALSPQTTPAL